MPKGKVEYQVKTNNKAKTMKSREEHQAQKEGKYDGFKKCWKA